MPGKKKGKSPARRRKDAATVDRMDFTALVAAIRQTHENCAAQAKRAVNVSLTMRNWMIGWYIREYEQNGADRATYGDALIENLAERLKSEGMDRMDARELRRYRLFYMTYPAIRESVTPEFTPFLPASILQSAPAKSDRLDIANFTEKGTPAIRESVTPELGVPLEKLFSTLSFTHLAELIAIDDPLKRAFYEVECLRGHWSVRQLKRQIATLYFERSGLSEDKEKLAAMVKAGAETAEPKLAIHDPYVFEFLGLKAKDAVEESDLEAGVRPFAELDVAALSAWLPSG